MISFKDFIFEARMTKADREFEEKRQQEIERMRANMRVRAKAAEVKPKETTNSDLVQTRQNRYNVMKDHFKSLKGRDPHPHEEEKVRSIADEAPLSHLTRNHSWLFPNK